METLEYTIPVELKDAIRRIADKSMKLVEGISLTFSKSYLQAYTHTYTWYDDDNNPHQKRNVQMHEVCDMVLNVPTSDWKLKCYWEEEMLVVADLKNELVIKNPNHGAKYRKCDCCGHYVYKYSCLIESTTTGEELQVGRECLKKYNLESFYKIQKMVFDALGLNRYEMRDLGFGSGELDMCEWPYKDINTGKQSRLVREMIRAAKAFYVQENGEWESAYWDGRFYQKSPSGEKLQDFSMETEKFSHIPEEYVDNVLKFVNEVIGEKIAKSQCLEEIEFDCEMRDSLSNVYMPLCLCHYAFFAVKKYEQYMERERQRLEMERLGRLQVGQQLHVKGVVVFHKTYEGYYGKYDVYEVRTERGYTLRRKGTIPVAEDKKTTEFYAQVLGVSSNGVVSLDRATKRPKKNIQYIAV